MREITSALLSPQFFQYVSSSFTDEIISDAQIRILLADIASCSLMRLDHNSLDKLLDLMIMIFKWQMFLMSNVDDLLNITLRHLSGIGRLMPEQGKCILVDQANQFFFANWNELNEEKRFGIVRKINKFLSPFNVRISLLIRMKLQVRDGSFIDKAAGSSNEFFRYYIQNLGENIYDKLRHFPPCKAVSSLEDNRGFTNEIDCLFQQFNVDLQQAPVEEQEPVKMEASSVETVVETRSNLDDLKRKCKMNIVEEAQADDDSFQNLLKLLDSSQP